MRSVKIFICCGFLILMVCSNALAKEWRGIVPLHSTCEDVQRILGIAKCETRTYYLQDENVSINFSEYPCGVRLPEGWNVPVGTVTSITVYPKIKPRLVDLKLELSKFRIEEDPEVQGNSGYTNDEEGFYFVVSNGMADDFTYFASAKDDQLLRCPGYISPPRPKPGEAYYTLPIFAQLGGNQPRNEKEILNDLAAGLRGRSDKTQAYIIAYAGRRALRNEAQARANQVKEYLVKSLGIREARVVAIDGGYRDEAIVELWIRPPGVAEPLPAPTVHPSQVQIIRRRTRKNRNRNKP
jgi:hypothetical protein